MEFIFIGRASEEAIRKFSDLFYEYQLRRYPKKIDLTGRTKEQARRDGLRARLDGTGVRFSKVIVDPYF